MTSGPSSIRWTKVTNIRHRLPGDSLSIRRVEVYCVPPPVGKHGTRIRDAEEYDDAAKRKAGVESSRKDVIVFCPPSKEAALDDVVEGEVDEGPAGIVDTGCLGTNQYLVALRHGHLATYLAERSMCPRR